MVNTIPPSGKDDLMRGPSWALRADGTLRITAEPLLLVLLFAAAVCSLSSLSATALGH